jgi:phosphohistidine phosphatase
MKTVIMVRHATAESKGTDKNDFERSLTKKGRKEAGTMVGWYMQDGKAPDLLLSSPANRAIETARIFAKQLAYPKKKIMLNESLYASSDTSEFLNILQALDDKHDSVMVFGHDPSFSDFAKYMVEGFTEDLPKCGVFAFTVNRRKWGTMKAGDGACLFFEHPHGIRERIQEEKQRRKDISARLENGIAQVLDRFGIERSDKEGRKIRRASARLARMFAHKAGVAQASPAKGKSAAKSAKEKGK